MTDLTRERLAELRRHADNIRDAHRFRGVPDYTPRAEYDALADSIVALIAQCEAGLPASGGVSGEDGLLDLIDKLGPRSNTPDAFARCATTIRSLLAERDGLKHANRLVSAAGEKATYDLAKSLDASNAALADALGLLRQYGVKHDAVVDFLAKHGPSP